MTREFCENQKNLQKKEKCKYWFIFIHNKNSEKVKKYLLHSKLTIRTMVVLSKHQN